MADVISLLRDAYNDEIETVANYLALSVHLDGVRAEEVKERLGEDVDEELGHARTLAHRLKELDEAIPGSQNLAMRQTQLQPPQDTTDVHAVVKGVLKAEEDAIRTYRDLIQAAREEDDPVTEDLAITILADEEKHRSLFAGYLKELEKSRGMQATPAGG